MGTTTFFFYLMVSSAAVLIALAVFSLSFRQVRSARLLAVTLLFAAMWPALSCLEMSHPGLSGRILYNRLRVIPVAFLPVFCTLVTLETTRRLRWLTPARALGLLLIPAGASVMVLIGDPLNLFHVGYAADPSIPFSLVRFERGPATPVLLGWSAFLLVSDIVLFLVSARGESRVARRQALLFSIGLAVPLAASFLVVIVPSTLRVVDPGALGVTAAGILAAVAFFRYRLLDLLPIVNTVLFEAIDDIALVFDVKGSLVGFNEKAEAELGLSRRTSPGVTELPAPWGSVLGPHAGEMSRRTEVELPGTGRAFDLSISPLRMPQGSALGRLVVLHETTERRRVEKELRYAKERLQIALESANEGLWDWKRDGTREEAYWSPRFFTMLGYAPDEIAPGRQAGLDLIHPEDRAATEASLEAARLGTAEPRPVEFRMRTRAGDWKWILCRYSVVERDSAGAALRIVGAHQDVTERRDAEAKLRGFIEQATEAISLVDTDGRIVEYNRSAEALTGYPRSAVIGTFVWSYQARLLTRDRRRPESESELEKLYRDALATGNAGFLNRAVPGSLLRADGAVRDFEQFSFAIRTYRGVQIGCISHDVTATRRTEDALRKSEAQLRQAQKMEAIGRLAGGVAHDFNNILTIIGGYSELLRDGQLPGSPVLEGVDAITRATSRAATLTRQLLAFSRKQIMETKVFCAGDLLRNVESMLARVIGEDVNLSILARPDLWAVRADPGQVEQVLMNLAVNARDAMPGGGTLVISTANAVLDADFVAAHPMVTAGNYVKIEVTDTGHGMDADTMARLFEPFFTTKAPGKGTGLGLSMAYGIVKQSGGHIFCESAVGRGTTFTMYFPRVEEKPESLAVIAAPSVRGQGAGKVLLVEDEPGVRGYVRTVLQRGGYEVEEAVDGQEALALSRRGGKDLTYLVTDVVMPRMGGPELAARVRESCPSIRVLYMSGYAETPVLHDDLREHAAAFLRKPFNPQDLLSMLREMKDPTIPGR